MSRLSTKPIPADERLIVALDVPTPQQARRLVDELGPRVVFYKLGLELFMSGEGLALARELVSQRGKKLFVDLKFFDVPATVAEAVRRAGPMGASFVTVHGNQPMLQAACEAKGEVGVLAVTALTSLDRTDLDDLGFEVDVATLVSSRARRALEAGCDGVVSSGLEVSQLRAEHGGSFFVITPGIRPVVNDEDSHPDAEGGHKRSLDVEDAFAAGADYVVIRRPIRTAAEPGEAAARIQDRIAALFVGQDAS
jgi:orotidine-5'-phosphate decarboxylase